MRIAIVVNRFPTLSETFIFNKVKGLVQQGLDVTVITHGASKDFYAYKEDWKTFSDKVKLVSAFTKRDVFSIRLFTKVLAHLSDSVVFFRTIRKNKKGMAELLRAYLRWLGLNNSFDIIHFEYSGLAITYLDVIPQLKKAKIVVSCRGAAEQIKPLIDKKRVGELKHLFQEVDCVHCVSTDMLNTCTDLYGLDVAKAFVNRPAINITTFARNEKRLNRDAALPFLFCSTGRLYWKKGFDYALLAMKELKNRGHSFQYEIIGSGIEQIKLAFMMHDLGLQNHIVFLGSLTGKEVKSRLEKCDIYVLPSLSEGISNAVLEAMAMELPVVTTRVGGMEEVIEDNVSGLLANAYDPIEMADKLEILMADEALRSRVALNGQNVIKREFTLQRQIGIFMEKYKQVLDA